MDKFITESNHIVDKNGDPLIQASGFVFRSYLIPYVLPKVGDRYIDKNGRSIKILSFYENMADYENQPDFWVINDKKVQPFEFLRNYKLERKIKLIRSYKK